MEEGRVGVFYKKKFDDRLRVSSVLFLSLFHLLSSAARVHKRRFFSLCPLPLIFTVILCIQSLKKERALADAAGEQLLSRFDRALESLNTEGRLPKEVSRLVLLATTRV